MSVFIGQCGLLSRLSFLSPAAPVSRKNDSCILVKKMTGLLEFNKDHFRKGMLTFHHQEWEEGDFVWYLIEYHFG